MHSPQKKTKAGRTARGYSHTFRELEAAGAGGANGTPSGTAASAAEGLGAPKELAEQAAAAVRAGRLDEADALFRRALDAFEALVVQAGATGQDVTKEAQVDALRCASGLAGVLKRQGKGEEAAQVYMRSIAAAEPALGPAHPATLAVVNNAALLLAELGNDEAAQLFRRALGGFELALGAEHPDTLSAALNLANHFADTGQLDEAAPLYRRAVDGFQAALGDAHPCTLSALNALATLQAEQEKLEEALATFERARAGFEAALGAEHPETLSTVSNMVRAVRGCGEEGRRRSRCRLCVCVWLWRAGGVGVWGWSALCCLFVRSAPEFADRRLCVRVSRVLVRARACFAVGCGRRRCSPSCSAPQRRRRSTAKL